MEHLLTLLYLAAFIGAAIVVARANYVLFLRIAFVPLALGAATVFDLLDTSYIRLSEMLVLGLAGAALLFLVVNVYIVLNKLLRDPDPKAVLQKVAFNKDYE